MAHVPVCLKIAKFAHIIVMQHCLAQPLLWNVSLYVYVLGTKTLKFSHRSALQELQ